MNGQCLKNYQQMVLNGKKCLLIWWRTHKKLLVYLYLDDDDDDDDDIDDDDYDICRKAKGTKKCVIEKMFRFHHYKNCIFYHYKNCICEAHNVYVKHIMYTLKKLTRLH